MAHDGFGNPNASAAAFPAQSEWFSQDIQILADGLHGNGVQTGCTVTQRGAGANMSVDVAAGTIVREGAAVAVGGGNSVVSAAHATLPRIDIVSANNVGAVIVTTGTAAAVPEPPTIPQVANVNNIVLAFVYVPAADTAVNTNQIVDKRALVNAPGAGTFTGGMSNLGNTSGTTGTVGSRLLIVGGNNITISQSINGQSATLTVSAGAGGAGVIATSVNPVASASSVGTVTRYAGEDHRHAGLIQAQISGNTSNTSNVIVGSLVLAGGNNITLSQVSAAGGATVTISAGATAAPIATAVKGVSSIGSTGTITRFAPEDHQHAGLHQISVGGNTAGATTAGAGSFMLAGGNNVTLSASTAAGGMTITVSAANETQTAPPIATAVKAVSSAGSTGTITRFAPEDHAHAGLNSISVAGNTLGNTTAGAGSLVLAGGPNITLSGATAGGGMTLSISGGAGAGGFAAGMSTGGNTAGTSGTVGGQIVLVGGSNVTISQSINGVSATATIIGAGSGAADQCFVEINGPVGGIGTLPPLRGASLSVRPLIQPFIVVGGGLSAKTMQFMASRSGGTSLLVTIDMGIYTQVNATSIALLSNTTNGFSLTASTEFSANRMYLITGLSNLTLSAGRYWMGLLVSATGTAVADLALLGAGTVPTLAGSVFAGNDQTSATNVSGLLVPFAGVYSATSGALPTGIGAADMWGGSGSSQHAPYYAVIRDV